MNNDFREWFEHSQETGNAIVASVVLFFIAVGIGIAIAFTIAYNFFG